MKKAALFSLWIIGLFITWHFGLFAFVAYLLLSGMFWSDSEREKETKKCRAKVDENMKGLWKELEERQHLARELREVSPVTLEESLTSAGVVETWNRIKASKTEYFKC